MQSVLEFAFRLDIFGIGFPLLVALGFTLAADEFKMYEAAKGSFYIAAAWALGMVFMWSYLTGDKFRVRGTLVFILSGFTVLMVSEGVRLVSHRQIAQADNPLQQAEAPKPPPPNNQQSSSGENSPNIIGNGNTVNVNPSKAVPLSSPMTFHEKSESADFYFNLGGAFAVSEPISSIRRKPFILFANGDYAAATVSLKGDKLLFSFKPWSGDGKPVIEVRDNVFTTRMPYGWDLNSNANALEVINEQGDPVFQMIRKSQTNIEANGVFAMPGGEVMLAGNGSETITKDSEQIRAFHLRPIFKYPSWKYPGEFQDK